MYEIGIRIALGARKVHVLRLALRQGFIVVAAGAAIGLAVALPVATSLRHLFFGVNTLDPVTATSSTAIIFVVTLGASILPACRANRIDPAVTLRRG
jgi:ABC-type antimicrobial peptide transport system permease subunit